MKDEEGHKALFFVYAVIKCLYDMRNPYVSILLYSPAYRVYVV